MESHSIVIGSQKEMIRLMISNVLYSVMEGWGEYSLIIYIFFEVECQEFCLLAYTFCLFVVSVLLRREFKYYYTFCDRVIFFHIVQNWVGATIDYITSFFRWEYSRKTFMKTDEWNFNYPEQTDWNDSFGIWVRGWKKEEDW